MNLETSNPSLIACRLPEKIPTGGVTRARLNYRSIPGRAPPLAAAALPRDDGSVPAQGLAHV